MVKKSTYYHAGRTSEGELYMFTCWNADKTSCGCHSVYLGELNQNIEALQKMGYEVTNIDQGS